MPLASDAQALVDAIAAANGKAYQDRTPDEGRAAYRVSCAAHGLPTLALDVEERTFEGPHGRLTVRLYRPFDLPAAAPAVLFLHGGGWVIGDLETHDPICRHLAVRAEACVIALDYRRSPAHRFPVALDEARAALAWLHAQARDLGLDPARLAVAGDSAGGNLCAVLALYSARGELPPLRAQILLYPVCDLAGETASYRRVVQGVPLTAASMTWFRDQYLDRADQVDDWRVSPLRAPSLAGAAPAFVVTCGQDPLSDEGIAYARRLEAEGVAVSHLHLADQMHGIFTVGGSIVLAGPILDLAAAWLAMHL